MLLPRLHAASYPVIRAQTQLQVKKRAPRWAVTIYRTVGSTRSFQTQRRARATHTVEPAPKSSPAQHQRGAGPRAGRLLGTVSADALQL